MHVYIFLCIYIHVCISNTFAFYRTEHQDEEPGNFTLFPGSDLIKVELRVVSYVTQQQHIRNTLGTHCCMY